MLYCSREEDGMKNRWIWLVILCIPILLVMMSAVRGTWGVVLWEEVILAVVATFALAYLAVQFNASDRNLGSKSVGSHIGVHCKNTRRTVGLGLIVLVWVLAALDINVFRHLTGAPVVVEFMLASLLTFGIVEMCSDEPA